MVVLLASGLVLMDQSMVAGIGNIYRAEILYKAAMHPEQPAHTVDRAAFERVWYHSVDLLQKGYATGASTCWPMVDLVNLGSCDGSVEKVTFRPMHQMLHMSCSPPLFTLLVSHGHLRLRHGIPHRPPRPSLLNACCMTER